MTRAKVLHLPAEDTQLQRTRALAEAFSQLDAAPEQHLADAAAAYAEAKDRDPSEVKDTTRYAWLALCDAVDAVVPEPAEMASQARFDLGLDEEGNPTDEFGFSVRTFNPSRVHPNDLCQSKGYS